MASDSREEPLGSRPGSCLALGLAFPVPPGHLQLYGHEHPRGTLLTLLLLPPPPLPPGPEQTGLQPTPARLPILFLFLAGLLLLLFGGDGGGGGGGARSLGGVGRRRVALWGGREGGGGRDRRGERVSQELRDVKINPFSQLSMRSR